MKTIFGAITLCAFVTIILIILLAPKSEKEALPYASLQAREIYNFNCSMCHGPNGQGNGPTVRALPVAPPNWTVSGWQSAVTDEGIKNAIVGGGKAIGRSDYMPAHPDLKDSEELDALVSLIREFGRR